MGQVGAILLGAAVGSSLDSPGKTKFLINYGIRTVDGQVREVRVESAEEIAKPSGQCVYLADLSEAAPGLCMADKVEFLKQLATGDLAANSTALVVNTQINKPVACRLPNVGLMTLEPAACEQLQGTIEK